MAGAAALSLFDRLSEIDVRVSSSMNNANFTTDGVDAAIRNLPVDAAHDEALEVEKLLDQSLMPVCSPAFVEKHGPFTSPDMLRGVPLIHDDSFSSRAVMPNWADWFAAAGVRDADVSRGLRFNSADHALDATVEGAGVLLAHDALAYDDLRTGRLVAPFDLTLPSGRCYCFVCAKKRRESANVRAFRAWLKEEAAAVDWSKCATRAADPRPAAESSATRSIARRQSPTVVAGDPTSAAKRDDILRHAGVAGPTMRLVVGRGSVAAFCKRIDEACGPLGAERFSRIIDEQMDDRVARHLDAQPFPSS